MAANLGDSLPAGSLFLHFHISIKNALVSGKSFPFSFPFRAWTALYIIKE